MHQLNVESTVRGVCCVDDGWLFPDSVLGTDSHIAVNNGLGVVSIGEQTDYHYILAILTSPRMCSLNILVEERQL